jgi:hypothetical protein
MGCHCGVCRNKGISIDAEAEYARCHGVTWPAEGQNPWLNPRRPTQTAGSGRWRARSIGANFLTAYAPGSILAGFQLEDPYFDAAHRLRVSALSVGRLVATPLDHTVQTAQAATIKPDIEGVRFS